MGSRRRVWASCLLVLWAGLLAPVVALAAGAPARPADLELTGRLDRSAHETYLELPFQVPPGTGRLTVVFSHDGGADRTTLDLGVADPHRFRGWSGGAREGFTLAASDATPGYLPGPLPPGDWTLLLGAPNLRAGVTTTYRARIWLDGSAEGAPGAFAAPLAEGPRWWRGDLHVHSGHSDGSCRSRRGRTIPCPLFRIAQAAAERGLDFIAVTEHNTSAHLSGLRELQPYFDDLLLMPGRELTTFQGHANLLGLTAPLEFRIGRPGAADIDAILATATDLGAVISVNHPAMPSGEACMGCGWRAPTDWTKVDAIEVLNGGAMAIFGGRAESPLSGLAFWQARLNEGRRLTAIAGSDSHDPDRPVEVPGALGRPATVIAAPSLSQSDLLAGLKQGRVFIDLTHPGLRVLDLTARAGDRSAVMGETLDAPAGARIDFEVILEGAEAGVVHVVESAGGGEILPLDGKLSFSRVSDGARGWVRVEVRSPDGVLMALGNPVYLNWGPQPSD